MRLCTIQLYEGVMLYEEGTGAVERAGWSSIMH